MQHGDPEVAQSNSASPTGGSFESDNFFWRAAPIDDPRRRGNPGSPGNDTHFCSHPAATSCRAGAAGSRMGEDASELDDAGDRSQLVVPSDVPALAGVRYLHGCFPEAFLQELDVVRLETEVSTSSQNMFANRRFLRSDELAAKVLSYLPSSLGFTRP